MRAWGLGQSLQHLTSAFPPEMGTRRWLGDHVRGGLKHLPTATTPPLLGSQRYRGDDQVGDTTSLVSHFCRPSVPAARRQLQCRPQQRGCHGHTWGAVDPSMCGKQALPHPKCRRDKEWPAELQMQSQRGWEGEREAEAGLAEGPTPGTAGGLAQCSPQSHLGEPEGTDLLEGGAGASAGPLASGKGQTAPFALTTLGKTL